MASTDFTILNPQQVQVTGAVYLPGRSLQSKLLAPQETWTIPGGVVSGQWVAFFDPETGELLASAALPQASAMAQILLDVGINGLLRMNPQEPLTAANGLDQEVTARFVDVGAAAPVVKRLAPRGQPGSSADVPYAARGQWLGFYDGDDTYITGTWANSFSEVALIAPGQRFVVGNPYPVGPAAAEVPEGAVRLTLPATHEAAPPHPIR